MCEPNQEMDGASNCCGSTMSLGEFRQPNVSQAHMHAMPQYACQNFCSWVQADSSQLLIGQGSNPAESQTLAQATTMLGLEHCQAKMVRRKGVVTRCSHCTKMWLEYVLMQQGVDIRLLFGCLVRALRQGIVPCLLLDSSGPFHAAACLCLCLLSFECSIPMPIKLLGPMVSIAWT